jgi:DNA-binding HxlR family transcriptional regulator
MPVSDGRHCCSALGVGPSAESRVAEARRLDDRTCAALEVLEGRWALGLLTALVPGPARFSELDGAVPGVSRWMMVERLRQLETAGLVRRTVAPGPPITSTYCLTTDGEKPGTILHMVRRWASSREAKAAS